MSSALPVPASVVRAATKLTAIAATPASASHIAESLLNRQKPLTQQKTTCVGPRPLLYPQQQTLPPSALPNVYLCIRPAFFSDHRQDISNLLALSPIESFTFN